MSNEGKGVDRFVMSARQLLVGVAVVSRRAVVPVEGREVVASLRLIPVISQNVGELNCVRGVHAERSGDRSDAVTGMNKNTKHASQSRGARPSSPADFEPNIAQRRAVRP